MSARRSDLSEARSPRRIQAENERKIMTTCTNTRHRSQEWFGKIDKMGFVYRSWMKNQGFPHHLFDGRPVIGICNTWFELTPCNAHFRMILKGAGPRGYPGFAEVGNMPLPAKVLRKGITDMVRISDGRMSGTAYGTVVLHVAPEAAVGGPLALVQTGDIIELDVPMRRLHLEVSDEELTRRKGGWKVPEPPARGWYRLFHDHVLQADQGVDLDFLVGTSGAAVPRDNH
jgi:dihydroxyacid dehydratase/phosphogluconate dehydratase